MSRIVRFLRSVVGMLVRSLKGANAGGPGRPHPWADADDLEDMRRREREIWRQDDND